MFVHQYILMKNISAHRKLYIYCNLMDIITSRYSNKLKIFYRVKEKYTKYPYTAKDTKTVGGE
jgi:hypothetical protein